MKESSDDQYANYQTKKQQIDNENPANENDGSERPHQKKRKHVIEYGKSDSEN